MSVSGLLYPMAALVFFTFAVACRVLYLRVGAVKSGQIKLSHFKAMTGAEPPGPVAAAARALNNLFEAPPVFYAGCVAVLALGKADGLFVALAWAYVAARVVQAFIHLSYNDVRHRLFAYLTGWAVLLLLWGRLVLVAG
ncbi:hypothetical protein HHL28_05115 [Aerophototrophica crusticola]|uniref:MAPEG family protein n=1 Tax=Aerophototrophica crusticola TaxID=1709002 RepID=A0A858R505_9PROT|nr:hypothetical protein HHL28_05115 [Rhodospirillaceae bacterium B3]